MSDSISPLENALTQAGDAPQTLAGNQAGTTSSAHHRSGALPSPRAVANFAAIEAELDAAPVSWPARVLRAVGVPDRTVPLITATPALRRSWVIAVLIAVLFSVNAAQSSSGAGVARITTFLTVAPLVPLLGVALAFGPRVDPTHHTTVAAPIDGFRLFLIRAVTVLATSSAILLIGAGLVPSGGVYRFAWLLPALAVTSVALALATRLDPRMAAATAAIAWLAVMLVATNRFSSAAAYGSALQFGSAAVAAAALVMFAQRRRQLDIMSLAVSAEGSSEQ